MAKMFLIVTLVCDRGKALAYRNEENNRRNWLKTLAEVNNGLVVVVYLSLVQAFDYWALICSLVQFCRNFVIPQPQGSMSGVQLCLQRRIYHDDHRHSTGPVCICQPHSKYFMQHERRPSHNRKEEFQLPPSSLARLP